MKPKNLKYPLKWESRAPLLEDGVLYIPKCYDQHHSWPKEELEEVLSSLPSVSIEFCSGNGCWIAEKAKEHPQTLWVAVEKRFDRVQKIWSKKHNMSLNNLLIICGDARAFVDEYLKDSCVDHIFINFPDPWPKDRHAKHRLIQGQFVRDMVRISKQNAEAIFVTDDATYSLQMIEEMLQEKFWISSYPEPFYKTQISDYGASYFDSLWREKGREIRYMKFRNNKGL